MRVLRMDGPTLRLFVALLLVSLLVLGLALGAAAQRRTEITWFVRTSPQEQPWQEKVIAEFERENPDVRVNLVITPWADFDTRLFAMIAGGEAPEVWSHWGPSGFQDYRLRGLIADLTPFIERDMFDLSDFIPDVLDIYRVDGRIYGLPFLSGGSFLFYNRDLFRQAGVGNPPTNWNDVSWTWDAALAAAKKMTRNYGDPGRAVYGFQSGFWPPDAWAWTFGRDIYPDEAYATGFADTAYLSSPEAVQAFQLMQDLIYQHQVAPTPALSQGLEAVGNPFHSGRIAMQPIGVWGLWVHKGLEEEFEYGIAALPKGRPNGRNVIFTDPWMLGARSRNPDAGWRFIQFLVRADKQEEYMSLLGAPPVRKSLLPKYFTQYPTMGEAAMQEVFLGALANGRESPNHLLVRFDLLNQVISAALDPINLNQARAADVLPGANADLVETLRTIKREFGR